jgi:hypothetical protein
MEKIEQIIKQAISELYLKDKALIDDEVHEQAISAKLMCYLQNMMPEWNVDVEFNRQGDNRDPKTDTGGVNRKPDIIIHKRGPEGPNRAVILVKCEWNSASREDDARIVRSLKQKHNYQSAFLLEIKRNSFQLAEF